MDNELSKLLYNIHTEKGTTKAGARFTKFYLDKIKTPEELEAAKTTPIAKKDKLGEVYETILEKAGIANLILFETDDKISIRAQRYCYFRAFKKGLMGIREHFGPWYLSINPAREGITIRLTKHKKVHAVRFSKRGRRGRNYRFYSLNKEKADEQIKRFVENMSRFHARSVSNQLEFLGKNSNSIAAKEAVFDALILKQVGAKLKDFKERSMAYAKEQDRAKASRIASKNGRSAASNDRGRRR